MEVDTEALEANLIEEAQAVASRCNAGEINKARQDTMKLAYHNKISEDLRDRLLVILQNTSCGG